MAKKKTYYYVSYYEEYPIYEPAEGGYYYAGEKLIDSLRVGSLKSARRVLRRMIEQEGGESEFDSIGKSCAYVAGRYVGQGYYFRIETIRGRHEKGYVPYC